MKSHSTRRSHGTHEFAITLRSLMQRPTYAFTPGWLSKVSGIPKATIVNWLEGRVTRPRVENALPLLCYALRLTPDETTALYRAVGAVEPIVREDRFFDRVPAGLYRTTPDGRILYANLTLVETLGYRNLRDYLGLDVTRDLYAKSTQRYSTPAGGFYISRASGSPRN
jgi:PAS domain-containing protein